jgi:NAD(P)-dependent dehydrogenase (short-subunit alcohol dehydrogenase family)
MPTHSKAVLITGCSSGIGAATAERLARRQFETNVFGLVRMCQLVLPGMRSQGWGKIVNLSSGSSRRRCG